MTDIETEAFAVYDGDRVVAIVKDSNSGEELLNRTMEELSRPDSGMTLVSSEFTNTLDIQPVNVLLGSVQSNEEALDQMVKGGSMEIYHIVEEGETVESLAAKFGVEAINIYDEDNENIATELEQGDGVCIRITVDPVSVKMVETGRLKEVIEYETIKKESDEYYKGDSFVEQEGQDGVQIFEGTLTKVAGEVTKRDETSIEVIKKKKNKIILVGTAERPKTAPTGTFARPINTYVVTSEFGGRWGRHHDGMDLGASTGTPIYASDGGTVTRATYYSGYGLCVDIDHENGRMTRYGHCSKLLVSAGDRVYQGQEIALVGNTGHSFGSHLHFEIRVGGSLVNPRKYVDF
jgi:murein DD-endopeptidase MepM/ murein hydrolase activator NlpD